MSTSSPTITPDGRAVTQKTRFSRQTSVGIIIHASPAAVWGLLTTARDIPRWNSTVIMVEGDIQAGGRIRLTSKLDPSRVFKLRITTFQPGSRLTWSDGTAPFFKGERTYTLTDNGNGTVTFTMCEAIGGLMFPMAAKHIPSFDDSFEQFAADLKKEAEIISHS